MLLDLGARGERALSRWRLVAVFALLAWAVVDALRGAPATHVAAAFVVVLAYAVAALWLAVRTRRPERDSRLAFSATVVDVAAAAACMAVLVARDAAGGLNSVAAWAALALAISATTWRADARTTALAGVLAVLCVPLLAGLAWLLHGVDAFASLDFGTVHADDLLLRAAALAALAALLGWSVHRARLLVETSGTDTLTGLPNRTWLLQRMPQLLETVQSGGGGLTVALVDLDHVRRINHQHGHLAGDRALRELAAALRIVARDGDWLVRLSGGEFLLVLRQPVGTTWEGLDALRRQFAMRPIDAERAGATLRATFSAGLASFPHDGRDLSSLMRRADERLQVAREEGRDKVVARA